MAYEKISRIITHSASSQCTQNPWYLRLFIKGIFIVEFHSTQLSSLVMCFIDSMYKIVNYHYKSIH